MRSDDAVPTCADLADLLAAGDDAVPSAEARRHIERCLRCQAEMAAYRRLRRSMRSLAEDPHGVTIPDGLDHRILVALDDAEGAPHRRVPAYAAATLGGIAAAAGVIALAARQRRGPRVAV